MAKHNKTKIVCTIGPASRDPETLKQLILAGMNIARLNFSHGSFDGHREDILTIRRVAGELGLPVSIMADLPGPKIRIGDLAEEVIQLVKNQHLILTTESIAGTLERISVNLPTLPQAVAPGKSIFLNDGFIHLKVERVDGLEVHCRVVVGGPLRSRKGLNIPDVDLGVKAFTDRDREIAEFALHEGVDALSQSFVERGEDLEELRELATSLGYDPFLIAKIERSQAMENLDGILKATDGIMVARGDLGVEIPIARIPVVQKEIVRRANQAGKPVITATHMLESMISHILPTRAEATDVANAILDGTDCVMLSGESAVGAFPVEAVQTLAEIAAEAERVRQPCCAPRDTLVTDGAGIIASSLGAVMHQYTPAAVVVPTRSGGTARNLTRFRLPVWLLGVSSQEKTCRDLAFSYGVIPLHEPEHPSHWRQWITSRLDALQIPGSQVVLIEGPSSKYPDRNNRLEIIDLSRT